MKITAFAVSLFLSISFSLPHAGAEQFRYDAHGKRDPAVPLIGQDKPGGAIPFSEIISPDDVKLEGIAGVMSGNKIAIINGEIVREGFVSGEIEVKKIMKKSVILTISGKEYDIPLPEEGGTKE
jgi:hypothetical protein